MATYSPTGVKRYQVGDVNEFGATKMADEASMVAAPQRQGFANIDPATGKPKMLPYTPGSGAGIFGQVMNDPARLGNLMGGPVGRAPGVGPTPPGGAGGGAGAPVPAPGGGGISVGPTGELPTDLLGQTAGNLSGALRGELPQDVINLIEQQAAERGISGGIAGSQAANYGGLRTLGLTSLDRMKGAEELLAGQFLNPKDKAAFDQARLDRESRETLARLELTGRQKHDADVLALEKEKLAEARAAQANELAFKKLQFDLQSLGGKYGVGGGAPGGAGLKYGSGNLSPYAGLKGGVLNRFATPGGMGAYG